VTRLHVVSYYHHVIVSTFVTKISSISTENLPQGTTPCLFTTDVAENLPQGTTHFLFTTDVENLPQGMTSFLLTTVVYAAVACLRILWNRLFSATSFKRLHFSPLYSLRYYIRKNNIVIYFYKLKKNTFTESVIFIIH
jgi:hypothetical protein